MEAQPAARAMTMWQKVNVHLLRSNVLAFHCGWWQTGIVPVRGVRALQYLNLRTEMGHRFCRLIWQHLLQL